MMNSRGQRKLLLANMILVAVILSVILFAFEMGSASSQSYEYVGKGIELWSEVYKRVLANYVDEIDPHELARNGVEGLLDDLDPYSSYFEQSDFRNLREDSQGEFFGLGILISTRDNYPTIVSPPFPETPAQRIGLQAGDKIIEIEDESTFKMPINEVVSKLRGRLNTKVHITVQRGNADNILDFTVTRARIPMKNIPFSGYIEDGVGYIKLNKFNEEALNEMRDAIDEILADEEQELRGVILDLRYNPGGLLTAAIEISNAFLPKGSLIVSTRGRLERESEEYYGEQMPVYPDMPLVVLINRGSASASEIVAGAIQDSDRGVIVGTTSFGKGSVQTLLGLPGNAGLKLTTAHYYTPSGRCIHRDFEEIEEGEFEEELNTENESESDSLESREKFYTLNKNRVVYGGGGITPDRIVEEKMLGNMVRQLISQSVFFNYAVEYTNENPDLDKDFQVDQELLSDFRDYISDPEVFEYKIPGKQQLDRFREVVSLEEYDRDILPHIDDLESELLERRQEDFNANIDTIKRILKREIASAKFGTAERTIASKEWDVQLQKAVDILQNPSRYQTILSSGAKTGIKVEE